MSWLYSRALVEAYSEATCSDGEPCAPSSGTPTPQAYCAPDKMTGFSRLSRFGMTFEPLTDAHGEVVLTWFLEAFPARRTAAHLEDESWQTISGRRCDGSWQMSLPGTSLPRTFKSAQSTAQPMNSSRWVTPSERSLFPRQTWVQTTFGEDTGFVHTPTTKANYSAASMQKWPAAREFVRVFGRPDPSNQEWLMGWPTGWTAFAPLETAKFQQWLHSHGRRSHV